MTLQMFKGTPLVVVYSEQQRLRGRWAVLGSAVRCLWLFLTTTGIPAP